MSSVEDLRCAGPVCARLSLRCDWHDVSRVWLATRHRRGRQLEPRRLRVRSVSVTCPLNAAVCLAFLVYEGSKMKLGPSCRERQMQFSGPTLRPLAGFYIKLEQFRCSLWAAKVCIWNIRPDNKSSAFKVIFKTSQLAYGPQLFLCVDHDFARIIYQEQYFHTCAL